MKQQVLSLLKKFDELNERIAAVGASDIGQLTALGRERRKMEIPAAKAKEWLAVSSELDALSEILADPSMAELAFKEKENLTQRKDALEGELAELLNPADPLADKDT